MWIISKQGFKSLLYCCISSQRVGLSKPDLFRHHTSFVEEYPSWHCFEIYRVKETVLCWAMERSKEVIKMRYRHYGKRRRGKNKRMRAQCITCCPIGKPVILPPSRTQRKAVAPSKQPKHTNQPNHPAFCNQGRISSVVNFLFEQVETFLLRNSLEVHQSISRILNTIFWHNPFSMWYLFLSQVFFIF